MPGLPFTDEFTPAGFSGGRRIDKVEFTAREVVELRRAYIVRIATAMRDFGTIETFREQIAAGGESRRAALFVSTVAEEERAEAAMMLAEWKLAESQ